MIFEPWTASCWCRGGMSFICFRCMIVSHRIKSEGKGANEQRKKYVTSMKYDIFLMNLFNCCSFYYGYLFSILGLSSCSTLYLLTVHRTTLRQPFSTLCKPPHIQLCNHCLAALTQTFSPLLPCTPHIWSYGSFITQVVLHSTIYRPPP